MKTVCIHQPNFLPHTGFFAKASMADILVIYDTAQYSKGSYTNRVRINDEGKERWLTVPVKNAKMSAIKDVEIDYTREWRRGHISYLLKRSRVKDLSLAKCLQSLTATYEQGEESLSIFNTQMIRILCGHLGLECEIVLASQVMAEKSIDATRSLIDICQELNATSYVSGKGGFRYMDLSQFSNAGITVREVSINGVSDIPRLKRVRSTGLSIVEDLCASEGYRLGNYIP